MKILIIGDSCKDVFVYGKSQRLSPEAPAPIFNPLRKKVRGGMAKNVYRMLKNLGVDVDLITNKSGIVKKRYIDKDTNHLFLRVDKNDFCERIKNLQNIDFNKYELVIISDYDKGFLTKKDIKQISFLHKQTFLDTKKKLGKWCKNIKYLKINRKEYKTNKKYVNKKLIKKTIITLDKDGCKFDGVNYKIETKHLVDKTGAGDCFLSSLCYEYLKSKDIIKSIKFANKQALNYVISKK